MKDKVFVPLNKRGTFRIEYCWYCKKQLAGGATSLKGKYYCGFCCKKLELAKNFTKYWRNVKKESDVLECLNKFKEARIFLDDNKRIGCINCNELSGFYYSIFNEDKQVFELKCSDCWFKECFGSVEEVKK